MPVSLYDVESQTFEAPQTQPETTTAKKKYKTTHDMVDDALIQLHSAKGTTLKLIYAFILNNCNMDSITRNREIIIKKYLKSLIETADIKNTTGKGLAGHFKLVDKKIYMKKVQDKIRKAKDLRNATMRLKRKTHLRVRDIAIPQQVTPPSSPHHTNNVTSVFDTPLLASQVHSSTPAILDYILPQAPAVEKKRKRKKPAEQNEIGTPRSSLPGKKRRLLNLPG